MTIEIKQLIIRAVVEEARARPLAAAEPRSRTAPQPPPSVAPPREDVDREAVIAECTRLVLRELRKERAR